MTAAIVATSHVECSVSTECIDRRCNPPSSSSSFSYPIAPAPNFSRVPRQLIIARAATHVKRNGTNEIKKVAGLTNIRWSNTFGNAVYKGLAWPDSSVIQTPRNRGLISLRLFLSPLQAYVVAYTRPRNAQSRFLLAYTSRSMTPWSQDVSMILYERQTYRYQMLIYTCLKK